MATRASEQIAKIIVITRSWKKRWSADFEHYYLLIEDEAGNVRAVQPVFFVRQNLVEGVPGKIRSVVDLIRKIFPRFLTMRVLMVGCGAGTGDLGACDDNDESSVANALQATLRTFAKQNKASLIVFKDFPENYRSALDTLRSNGYARIPSMPMTRLPLHIWKLGRILRHAE